MVDTTRPAPTAAGSEVFGAAGIPLAVAAVAGKKWTTGATDAFVNKTERTNLRHTHIYIYIYSYTVSYMNPLIYRFLYQSLCSSYINPDMSIKIY